LVLAGQVAAVLVLLELRVEQVVLVLMFMPMVAKGTLLKALPVVVRQVLVVMLVVTESMPLAAVGLT
jgi:hypothetical protein